MKRLIVSLVICVMAALSTAACTSSTCPPGYVRVSSARVDWLLGYMMSSARSYALQAAKLNNIAARDESLSALKLLEEVKQRRDDGENVDSDKVMRAAHMLASVERQLP